MKYKLVIFDWDGTLMDSASRIVSSMQRTAILCGQPEPSATAVQNIIGLSLDVAVERLFGQADADTQNSIVINYKDQYVNHDQTPTPMFAGALDLLDTLKREGYKLAVATGKGRPGLQNVLTKSGTEHFFVCTRTGDEAQSKPSPDMLQQILVEMGLEVKDAVMIGDTEYDLGMAKAIGMDSIGVSFGVHERERLLLQGPLTVVDSLLEIRGWL
ncbi:MAG: HAD-IA family hydrolase [Algicola sp.]|nr:HAD-IA family hydrolase [Algicola sp.]